MIRSLEPDGLQVLADYPRMHRARLNGLPLVLALTLVLLAVAGCARIKNPEGWAGGAVAGDTLYIGSAEGELVALDRSSGKRLWIFELRGEDESERAIYGTPAVDDGTVYVGGYDGFLYALSLVGELKWQERVGGLFEDEVSPIVGSPVVVGDLVLVGSSDGSLYAFDAVEGSVEWTFETDGKVWSTPAVLDGVAYFGSLDHYVYAVRLDDVSEVWRFKTKGAVAATPAVADGRVYVGSFDGTFYALDANTGDVIWRFDGASNWFWGQALVVGDIVYVPSMDGNLYALDADTGGRLWTVETEGPIVGAPAVVFDMIAVPSDDGRVRLAGLGNGSPRGVCNVGEKIRTSLVADGGFIYFGARDKSVRALSVAESGDADEEWVHFTNKENPLVSGLAPSC